MKIAKGVAAKVGEDRCLGCGKRNNDLSACTGCFEASFCNIYCQSKAWRTHAFDCLPCGICEERIPGIPVSRDCACNSNQGYSHITCLVNAAAEDSGGKAWDHTSTLWKECEHCGEPFTGETKKVLEEELEIRIRKAKERLEGFLELCRDVIDWERDLVHSPDDTANYFGLSREAIDLNRDLRGDETWSCDEMFWAFLLRGRLLVEYNLEAAVKMFELVRTNVLQQNKWKRRLCMVTLSLGDACFLQENFDKALLLFEEIDEKLYGDLQESKKRVFRERLANCYYQVGACKKALKALKLVDQACEENEQASGSERQAARARDELRAKVIKSYYIVAESHGMQVPPDGGKVKIKNYSSDGFFSVTSPVVRPCDGDAYMVEGFFAEADFSWVPVEQVVMVPDSDVVLHSLKGAKDLNGKIGVVEGFNHELGRYKVILEGKSKAVNVKPQNLFPAYMGCEKEAMIEKAKKLSNDRE